MNKNESFQLELLTRLFLRLNGYFTTSLIIHSEKKGNIKTEVDIIGIRFPYHSQSEREIRESKILEIEDNFIDIVVTEVKSNGSKFNSPLSDEIKKPTEQWETILKWIGLFTEHEINKVKTELSNITENKNTSRSNQTLQKVRLEDRKINIKPILFVYKESEYLKEIDFKFVTKDDVFSYCKHCLCPELKRERCSTIYNIESWAEFEKIVKYFKNKKVTAPWNLNDFFDKINMQTKTFKT